MITKFLVAAAVIVATASASFAATHKATPHKVGKIAEPSYFTHATGAEWWRA